MGTTSQTSSPHCVCVFMYISDILRAFHLWMLGIEEKYLFFLQSSCFNSSIQKKPALNPCKILWLYVLLFTVHSLERFLCESSNCLSQNYNLNWWVNRGDLCEMRFVNDSTRCKFPSNAVDCSTWRFSPAFSRHARLNGHDDDRLQRIQPSSVGPLYGRENAAQPIWHIWLIFRYVYRHYCFCMNKYMTLAVWSI